MELRKKAEKVNIDLVIIPGGIMSWLKVLNIITNSFLKITLTATEYMITRWRSHLYCNTTRKNK